MNYSKRHLCLPGRRRPQRRLSTPVFRNLSLSRVPDVWRAPDLVTHKNVSLFFPFLQEGIEWKHGWGKKDCLSRKLLRNLFNRASQARSLGPKLRAISFWLYPDPLAVSPQSPLQDVDNIHSPVQRIFPWSGKCCCPHSTVIYLAKSMKYLSPISCARSPSRPCPIRS